MKDTEGTKNEQVKKKPPEDTDARTRSTVRRECTACVRYTVTVFETGSFVLVKRRDGTPSRLHTVWLGPMKVLENTGPEYRLLNLITMKEKLYHAQHMKPFLFNPHQTDPTDVARRDYVEYFVEKILDHKGKPKRLTSLEFLVKWFNYDDEHNSWEPYTNLRKTAGLHTYLREKNLLSLIPKEFR